MLNPEDRKLLTSEQLCDILEVYLGRERGRAECHRLIDAMKDDDRWRAEMDTLGSTVRVFQRMECEKPPEDVCFRLMKVLDLAGDKEDGELSADRADRRDDEDKG